MVVMIVEDDSKYDDIDVDVVDCNDDYGDDAMLEQE